MAHSMLMFEAEPDSDLVFDFDSLSFVEKKVFIERVFKMKRTIIDMQFSGTIVDHFFMSMLEKVSRENLNDIINALSGRMTFKQFMDFFGDFSYNKMDELAAFRQYEDYQRLSEKEVQLLRSYACRQLVYWTSNRKFYQDVYNECNDLYLVIEWRKKHELCALAQKGEKVVDNTIKKF